MGKVIAAVLIAAVLAGCAVTPKPTGSLCTIGPFLPSRGAGERWTDTEKDQLIVLNESGEKLCGWKAP